ncbi:LytR/AlgR family response regulator transcription factor [Salisediminibacterium selenitireducens]|nr:response regulator [Salisediminibacterium selenitireducens]
MVVDDEILAISYMKKLVSRISAVTLVLGFDRGETALSYLEKEAVDLILLDIQMPEINGVVMAEKVNRLYPGIAVIFVTANRDCPIDDLETNVVDCLIKPVRFEHLCKTVEKYMSRNSGVR